MLRPLTTLECSLLLPQCSLLLSRCFLSAPSNAALLPFPTRDGNLKPKIRGVYNIYFIYALNLGFIIAVLRQKKKQGCFKESTEEV